jgi:transcriptional regulator with XRE-family HTH domain
MSSETTAAFLGAELRRARTVAGLSQDQLAQRLGFDRTTVTKTESGQRTPSPELADALDVLFPHLDGLFARLAAHARHADGPVPAWFLEWVEAERVATSLRVWHPLIVPGLFQTADYARALFMAGRPGISEEDLDQLVDARLARQIIFDVPEPPHCVVVLDESVLRRRVGTPQIMHDQVMHLAGIAGRPYVTLQIVPYGPNAGLSGGFMIASADGTSDVVIAESLEDVTSGARAFVRKAAVVFDIVRGEALPVAASRRLILEVAGQWKSQV